MLALLLLLLLPLLWAGSLQEDPGFSLQVPGSVVVQEGLCTLVHCSFSYPRGWRSYDGPPFISWYWEGRSSYYGPVATNNPSQAVDEETEGRFHLTGDIEDNNCSLSITGARNQDEGNYVLQIKERRNYGQKYTYREKLNLRVTALTEKPDIHVEEPLQAGRPARLSCSLPGLCQEGGPVNFSWMGDVLNSMLPEILQHSALTLTPRPQDHDANLTCQVTLGRSQLTTERTVQLNVSYAPQNLSVSLFFSNGSDLQITQNTSSLEVVQGQALRLRCAAQSNPPASLSWCRESPAWNASCFAHNATLQLLPAKPRDAGGLTCVARNPLGSQTLFLNFSLVYPPQLLGPSCSWEAGGLHCHCSSEAWPAPSLRWRLGEELLEGNRSNASFTITPSAMGPWANSSLSLRGELTSVLRLSCEARNVHGSQKVTVLLLAAGTRVSGNGSQMLAALGGAGAMALLCLCLCLAFLCIMKIRKLRSTGHSKSMDDKDPTTATVNWASKQEPWPDSPPNQVSPVANVQPSNEPQGVHYASLDFQGMKFKEAQPATSTTEYSEIKKSK